MLQSPRGHSSVSASSIDNLFMGLIMDNKNENCSRVPLFFGVMCGVYLDLNTWSEYILHILEF